MKLFVGTGKLLEVRDAGPVLIALRASSGGPPIKEHGLRLLEDDAARERVRELLASGMYERDK